MVKAAKPRERQAGPGAPPKVGMQRILVGVRIEPRLVKVMKALSELHDCALGELIEKVIWNAMDGQSLFSDKNGRMTPETRQQIQSLKQVYDVTYQLQDLVKPRAEKK